ncbi:bacteriohemerythrin [candidate division KSB1 bacterium]
MEVKWISDIETGVLLLDTQNRNLINKITKLGKAIDNGRGHMEVDKLIAFFDDYVTSHFALEEKFMLALKYPERSFHKGQHKEFRDNFHKMKGEFSNNHHDEESVKFFQYEMWRFYQEHLTVVDAEFARYFKKKASK